MQLHRATFIAGAAAAAATAAVARPALPASAEADLYAAAKKEGAVVWWATTYDIGTYQLLAAAFEKKYPGITVSVSRLLAGTASEKMLADVHSGVHEVDVFNMSDEALYQQLKKMNALAAFAPPEAAHLPPQFAHVDPDNTYQVGSVIYMVLAYSPKAVPAPQLWTDLLDPRWKSQISTADPRVSGSAAQWAIVMTQRYGNDFLKRFAANDPKVGRSYFVTVDDIMSGERLLGMSDASYAYQKQAAGNAVDVHWPPDGSVQLFTYVAVPRDARIPTRAVCWRTSTTAKSITRSSRRRSSIRCAPACRCPTAAATTRSKRRASRSSSKPS